VVVWYPCGNFYLNIYLLIHRIFAIKSLFLNSNMKIIEDKISISELKILAEEYFGDFVKAVVDVERQIAAFGGELHSDEEALLLQNGSEQADLWGINIYPDEPRDKWIEFDSMINIRPRQKNMSRNVEDEFIQKRIIDIINKIVN